MCGCTTVGKIALVHALVVAMFQQESRGQTRDQKACLTFETWLSGHCLGQRQSRRSYHKRVTALSTFLTAKVGLLRVHYDGFNSIESVEVGDRVDGANLGLSTHSILPREQCQHTLDTRKDEVHRPSIGRGSKLRLSFLL